MNSQTHQPIRAVLFDFDDTLVDSTDALVRLEKHWYTTLPRRDRPANEEEFLGRLFEPMQQPFSLWTFYARMLEIWPGCFDSVEAALEAHSEVAPNMVAVEQTTTTMLKDLRSHGVPVGVVTNGPTDMQWGKVRNTGVADLVDAVVVSEEFGVNKPHPAIFNRALGLIGASPSETLFVGDNQEADIVGAGEVGMRTAWMSHGRSWEIASYTPTHVIEHVWDVRPLLGI